jgi:hypothetical protein
VYANTLAEELRGIDKKLAVLESDLHLGPGGGEMQLLPNERPGRQADSLLSQPNWKLACAGLRSREGESLLRTHTPGNQGGSGQLPILVLIAWLEAVSDPWLGQNVFWSAKIRLDLLA